MMVTSYIFFLGSFLCGYHTIPSHISTPHMDYLIPGRGAMALSLSTHPQQSFFSVPAWRLLAVLFS